MGNMYFMPWTRPEMGLDYLLVSIVLLLFGYQNLYYRILTRKLVNQRKELQWRL